MSGQGRLCERRTHIHIRAIVTSRVASRITPSWESCDGEMVGGNVPRLLGPSWMAPRLPVDAESAGGGRCAAIAAARATRTASPGEVGWRGAASRGATGGTASWRWTPAPVLITAPGASVAEICPAEVAVELPWCKEASAEAALSCEKPASTFRAAVAPWEGFSVA